MDDVVMDGSAVGILGKLSDFKRKNDFIKCVLNVSDRQYIMRAPKSRLLIDSIKFSSKKANQNQI